MGFLTRNLESLRKASAVLGQKDGPLFVCLTRGSFGKRFAQHRRRGWLQSPKFYYKLLPQRQWVGVSNHCNFFSRTGKIWGELGSFVVSVDDWKKGQEIDFFLICLMIKKIFWKPA